MYVRFSISLSVHRNFRAAWLLDNPSAALHRVGRAVLPQLSILHQRGPIPQMLYDSHDFVHYSSCIRVDPVGYLVTVT